MFILGHIGLTIGLLLLGLIIFKKYELINQIDFRLIALFAILPDIIDKTIGYVIFRGTLNNGRLFSHTLLFLIIFCVIFFLIIGSYWWVYSFPIITHQLFDTLWFSPELWFWPGYGWSFKALDINVWEHWYSALINDPFIISTEIMGFIIIVIIIVHFKIYIRKNFIYGLKTGRLYIKNKI